MISVTELRNGTFFEENGDPWEVLKYEHTKMGRGSANVKLKVRNLRSGHITEKSFISNAKVNESEMAKIKVTYLYKDGQNFVFMDQKTYEQFPISKNSIGEQEKFLKEGLEVILLTWNNQALNIEMPRSIELQVLETGPGVKGNSVSNVLKPATLENGLTINVPLFINSGNKIKVDTRTGEYLERVN